MISGRKQSYNGSEFSNQEIQEMLFDISKQQPKKYYQLKQNILQYYDPSLHRQLLANHCFRSHYSISKIYNSVRIQIKPLLQEPRISQFYENHFFPDLVKISEFFEGKRQKFPNEFIPPLSKNLKDILDELFQQYGFIPNLQRFLLFYPMYLQKHHKLCKYIFQHPQMETLNILFISICAAAQMGCLYMVSRLTKKFSQQGGEIEWITNGSFPQKLSRLIPLCRLLGRCPWIINEQTIYPLIQQQVWSNKQIAFFCQLIVFTQQISTICLATGLNIQEPIEQLNLNQIIQHFKKYNQIKQQSQNTQSLGQLKYIMCQQQKQSPLISKKEEVKKSFKKEEKIEKYMTEIGKQLSNQKLYQLVINHFKNILPEFSVIEKRKQHKFQTFDFSECNFRANIYPILFTLTPDIVDPILDIYQFAQEMTLNNFGTKSLGKEGNTKAFRKALTYYSENLLGFTHHQYDYKNIGQKLLMPLKFYIRLLTLSPIHINKQVLTEMHHEQTEMIGCLDLGHIAILVANTKMIYSLVMGIRSLGL